MILVSGPPRIWRSRILKNPSNIICRFTLLKSLARGNVNNPLHVATFQCVRGARKLAACIVCVRDINIRHRRRHNAAPIYAAAVHFCNGGWVGVGGGGKRGRARGWGNWERERGERKRGVPANNVHFASGPFPFPAEKLEKRRINRGRVNPCLAPSTFSVSGTQ